MQIQFSLDSPIYEKLEANLVKALLSIPATKGLEIGSGDAATHMKDSAYNDAFTHLIHEFNEKSFFIR